MITLILFLLILGVIVFVHEFGHFIFAKKTGVHVYEFSIGFGPKIFSFRRKNDETEYMIKLIPLGGYVAMAGELSGEEDDKSIKEDKRLYKKPWLSRLMVMFAGVMNNFILGFILLFIIGLIYGTTFSTNIIDNIDKTYPLYQEGVRNNDKIIKINNAKIKDYDDIQTELAISGEKSKITITVLKPSRKTKTVKIKPKYNKKDKRYYYGISVKTEVKKGFLSSIKYAFIKFGDIFKQMLLVIKNLFIGRLGLNSLSGPVGIYTVVGQAKSSLYMILYLTAYLSINVGFINLIPFPAFDGGHILFLIIEKIKGSKVNPELENKINAIGFTILMLLMLIITVKDIITLL